MQDINRQQIGEKLRKLRGERAQSEVADAIGVTTMAVSQYERGERVPNDTMKIRLANYYQKSVEDLFFTSQVINTITNLLTYGYQIL